VNVVKLGAVLCAFCALYVAWYGQGIPANRTVEDKFTYPQQGYIIHYRVEGGGSSAGQGYSKRMHTRAEPGDIIHHRAYHAALTRNGAVIAWEIPFEIRMLMAIIIVMLLPLILFIPKVGHVFSRSPGLRVCMGALEMTVILGTLIFLAM
jgi:hypothetical protein